MLYRRWCFSLLYVVKLSINVLRKCVVSASFGIVLLTRYLYYGGFFPLSCSLSSFLLPFVIYPSIEVCRIAFPILCWVITISLFFPVVLSNNHIDQPKDNHAYRQTSRHTYTYISIPFLSVYPVRFIMYINNFSFFFICYVLYHVDYHIWPYFLCLMSINYVFKKRG